MKIFVGRYIQMIELKHQKPLILRKSWTQNKYCRSKFYCLLTVNQEIVVKCLNNWLLRMNHASGDQGFYMLMSSSAVVFPC